jgi:hypothetical protein
MNHFIRTTLKPGGWHGRGKRGPFFEGWYLKLVDADGETALALIPGIHIGRSPAQSQAFVMVVDSNGPTATFHPFPPEQFQAAEDRFDVQIGPNHFSADGLTVALPGLHGSVRFRESVPWPVTWRSPGIMGWYAWVPVMECYHGIVSLDHTLDGVLTGADRPIDFSGGRGYIEKDWGRNFPRTWVWMQSNHFSRAGISLTASVARIPWFGREFPGFIIGLWLDGVLHRFTTYVGAVLEALMVDDQHVHITTRNRTHRLTLRALRTPTALLHGPTPDRGMVPFVNEALGSEVAVTLATLDGAVLFDDIGRSAGLEIQGDLTLLQPPPKRP